MDKGNPSPSTRNSNPQSANAPQPPGTVTNIIVFGETGVGKSSLIRMLDVSGTPPDVSGDASGCTTDIASYLITIGNAKDVGYRVWDTPGLNEVGEDPIAALEVLLKIHGLAQSLIRNDQMVDLLIYCIRAPKFRKILRVNYDLVAKTIFKQSVPVVLVVTGLENQENMDEWWRDNGENFNSMAFVGHACVTTTKGKKVGDRFMFEEEYTMSKSQVQDLIQRSTLKGASQGETLPETATKVSFPKSFIQNHSKVNGGIDSSEPNANTDPSTMGIIPPSKIKNTDEANAVLPRTTVDEDRTKPNTDANENPSVTPFASSIPKVNVNSDSHAKIDDLHTKREANPSLAADNAKGIDGPPKLGDERDQRNPDADSAPTTGDEAKTNEINKLDDSNQVMDDDNSESFETDSDDDSSDGNIDPAQPPNIIVFGGTGVGKSSLIRMLGGASIEQPKVSGDAAECTTDTAYYSITIGNGKKEVRYRVWDTPGLSEGGKGTVPTLDAFQRIHDRVQELDGVSLLVYCIRAAEYTDILQVNYDLVARVVCGGKVPVVAVVSWLENEEDMESWWKENKGHLKKMIKLKGHACVTTTKGKKDGDKFVFQQEYDDSKKRVQNLIKKRRLSKGIKPDPIADLKDAFKKYMDEHNSGDENRKMAGRLIQLFIN